MSKRNVVRASRVVAKAYWLRPFEEVLAAARSGEDGLRAEVQVANTNGYWPMDNKSDEATLIESPRGHCELFQQGW